MYGTSVLRTGLLTLLTPLAARGGFAFLVALRVLEGIVSVSFLMHENEQTNERTNNKSNTWYNLQV